jgi:hypothetical protein
MKKTRVWRYNCDFCGKRGYSAGHMKHHEEVCTMNPNRICGMCRHSGFEQKPIKELISALQEDVKAQKFIPTTSPYHLEELILDNIRLLTDCPACILSAIRQGFIQGYDIDEDGVSAFYVKFDYKKECEKFWSDKIKAPR